MRKLKAKEMKYVLYFLIIVFVVSSFSFINFSSNKSDTVTASLAITGLGQDYYEDYSLPVGANLYYLLYQTGFVSFQSDYSVKCVGQVCNDYVSANYWQVFLNSDYVGMDYLINGSEEFVLYYGKRINLINVSVELNYGGFAENTTLRVPLSMNLFGILTAYNATVVNDSISCIFDACGNWTVLVNNEIKPYNYSFSDGDTVFFGME